MMIRGKAGLNLQSIYQSHAVELDPMVLSGRFRYILLADVFGLGEEHLHEVVRSDMGVGKTGLFQVLFSLSVNP